MKELNELKAAFRDLQLVSERNLFIIQMEHKIETLEKALMVQSNKATPPDPHPKADSDR